jgi:translation initiation factor IF-2
LATRIYTLAKELKLDNKVLVDVCNKIGITGKGSALASLSDEEVAAIKVHLGSGGKKAGGTATLEGPATRAIAGRGLASSPVARRDDHVVPSPVSKKVPVLEKRPEKPAAAKPTAPATAAPEVEAVTAGTAPPAPPSPPLLDVVPPPLPVVESAPSPTVIDVPVAGPAVVDESPSSVAAAMPEAVSPPAEEPALMASAATSSKTGEPPAPPEVETPAAPVEGEPVERTPAAAKPDRMIRPLRPSRPDRPMDRLDRPAKPRSDRPRPERTGPSIKLAPLPQVQQPSQQKPAEPTPQKPDIKLAPDAIRASKAGGKPLSEHIRKQEEKRKAGGKKPAGKTPAAPNPAEIVDLLAKKEDKDRARKSGPGTAAPVVDDEARAALGGREQRQLKRKRTSTAKRRTGDEEESAPAREARRLRRTGNSSTAAPRKNKVVLDLPCTVRSFAETMGLPVQQVLGKLLELGMMSSITATITAETAELLTEAMGVEAEFREDRGLEEKLIPALEGADNPANLKPRPPVVTVLGHVDHGKTSLLDRILGLNVAAGEKGGITQCIRAYQIEKNGRPISFVDTPGHEAFTAMRARGANCTDIAVLVVAADDGVMPQTEEAISHAKAAGVPIIVALNKVDLPGINSDRIMQELATNDLLPSQWGGDTELVRTSAMTGEGIDSLLETILTVADLHEYVADPDRPATGVCLEAEVQQGRGVVAKVLVQKGTLRPGDVIVCGPAHGRVKAMYDTLNPYKKLKEAGPSVPVNITGLDSAPNAGDRFHVLGEISEARRIAADRAAALRQHALSGGQQMVTLETLHERLGQMGEVQTLNIILRADVRGSTEAIRKELTKLEHPEVQIKVLQALVGGITEADVHLAAASNAVIIGFNVVPDEGARTLAEATGVQIRRYDIIYQLTADLKAALEGMLKPEKREAELGRALVQRVFHISRVGAVAGCRVLSGTVQRDCRVRIIRENRIVGDYGLDSLKREKDDAREVREGFECGIKLAGFNDLKEGDILEAYKIEEIRRTF